MMRFILPILQRERLFKCKKLEQEMSRPIKTRVVFDSRMCYRYLAKLKLLSGKSRIKHQQDREASMIRVRIISIVMALALFVGTAVVPVRTSAQGLVEYAIILMEGAVSVEDQYLELLLGRRPPGASNSEGHVYTDPGVYTIILTVTDDTTCHQVVDFDVDLSSGRVTPLIVKIEPSRVREEKLAVTVFLNKVDLLDDEDLLECFEDSDSGRVIVAFGKRLGPDDSARVAAGGNAGTHGPIPSADASIVNKDTGGTVSFVRSRRETGQLLLMKIPGS